MMFGSPDAPPKYAKGTPPTKQPVSPEDSALAGITPLSEKDKFGPARAWSFSTLMQFEKCPFATYLKTVKKIPQKENQFSERGTQIHQEAEDFVSGKLTELPITLQKFDSQFHDLRDAYNEGRVSLEGEWAFTHDWEPVGWRDNRAWARIKGDAMVFDGETSVRIIDHKTGKKFGNEIKHNQQLQLYSIAACLLYPKIEFIQTELWYLDQGQETVRSYTRDEALLFLTRWQTRADKMTSCKQFLPKPSKSNCKYCPYNENCEWKTEV